VVRGHLGPVQAGQTKGELCSQVCEGEAAPSPRELIGGHDACFLPELGRGDRGGSAVHIR
jgi:hypothetical protein